MPGFVVTRPGDGRKLVTPQKIIAGTDRVAVDAYSAKVLGLDVEKVHMIKMAYEHGFGEMNLDKLQIEEREVT